MAHGTSVTALVLLAFAGGWLLSACSDEESEPPPGLDPTEEIQLEEVEPAPSDDAYNWSSAYRVDDLPSVNVGQPTPEFLELALREGDDPEDFQCLGDASGSGGCAVDDGGPPAISGLTFGGPDVRAWSWQFVPDDTVAVRFTDQEGSTSWQFAKERLALFPDSVSGDRDDNCVCRFDAIDSRGEVIASVDLQTGLYIED